MRKVITSASRRTPAAAFTARPRRQQPHQVHLSPHLRRPKDKSFNTEDKLGHTHAYVKDKPWDDATSTTSPTPTTSRS